MFSLISIKELHIHSASVDEIVLNRLATTIGALIMGTKEEVLAAVAAEKEEVSVKIDELNAKIDELIAAQVGATPADLEEIKLAIQGIFTPAVVVPVE
jgi:hypothetical protein